MSNLYSDNFKDKEDALYAKRAKEDAVINPKFVLEKAIRKAIESGLDMSKARGRSPGSNYESHIDPRLYTEVVNPSEIYWLIFNHDFAKALWPWDDSIKCPYCGICLTGSLMHPRPCPFGVAEVFAQPMWRYHLQQMVIAENPLEYLGQNL